MAQEDDNGSHVRRPVLVVAGSTSERRVEINIQIIAFGSPVLSSGCRLGLEGISIPS